MFVMLGTMPYFYKGGLCYPCEISATTIKVDFKNGKNLEEEVKCLFSEDEIKQRLNIKLIDGWDAKNKKVIKVSNSTVSSIKALKAAK